MGCKNMGGSADFRDHPNSGEAMGIMVSAAAHAMHYRHMPQHPSTYMSMPHHLQQQQQQQQHPVMRASNDPWIAAQSLTFLKRSSPASDRRDVRLFSMGVSPIAKSTAVAENASMPSLASSSEGTSPGEGAHHHYPRIASTPESSIDKAGGDSALLMAAVAMTEFGQSPPPTSSMLSPKTIRTYSGTDDNNDNESIGENEAFSNASKRSINFDESAGDLKGKRAKTGWMD